MKKIIALLCAVLLVLSVVITAAAAGVDDGKVSVATKDGQQFLGTTVTEGCVKFVAADGSGAEFYDLTEDKDMDICDLVALEINEIDFDLNDTFNSDDAKALRLILIGAN